MTQPWAILIVSLFDWGNRGAVKVPGPCVDEWLALAGCDFDDVDRMILDGETIGG